MSEIKSCPFCGSGDIRVCVESWRGELGCRSCHTVFLFLGQRQEALDRWNSRPMPAIVWRGDRAFVGELLIGELSLDGVMLDAVWIQSPDQDGGYESWTCDTLENRELARAAVEANWARVWGLMQS